MSRISQPSLLSFTVQPRGLTEISQVANKGKSGLFPGFCGVSDLKPGRIMIAPGAAQTLQKCADGPGPFRLRKGVASYHCARYAWEVKTMPTIPRIGSFRFHFYSDEGSEPPHIHVATPDGECKFWLEPIRLARNKGVPPRFVREIEKLIFARYGLLREKYDEYHDR